MISRTTCLPSTSMCLRYESSMVGSYRSMNIPWTNCTTPRVISQCFLLASSPRHLLQDKEEDDDGEDGEEEEEGEDGVLTSQTTLAHSAGAQHGNVVFSLVPCSRHDCSKQSNFCSWLGSLYTALTTTVPAAALPPFFPFFPRPVRESARGSCAYRSHLPGGYDKVDIRLYRRRACNGPSKPT